MDDFSDDFRAGLHDLMKWRRDVRHFKTDPVDEALVRQCLDTFSLAPSVGLSEPWRVLHVRSETARTAAIENFQAANEQALTGYDGDKAALYASLKLSGMREAPEHFAIYCDDETSKGAGLGAGTMPEMRRYSVVGAVTLMWLTARSLGLGIGWVSVLDPVRLNADLDVPEGWTLVAYLCLGWPSENTLTPELETKGWEKRAASLHIESR
ncbi:Cobalamin biosynthesis protein BluB [Sulfitobacter noctilucicola]|uniref:5,6-dimethylbenzimidazole synthase n=1 Tax=Sulfitobacter noctilucicola TaxID=1342301 RepID=A0A7W6M6P0_9RHOB|nr:5,6-dimethylbenzimidazole synthase [Sulfitobacter noctilucicola]KIN62354.1 Cobalamin biosynthesis protein BluB [Sulfitobacter noctilucicola]MBB4173112.1 5,6-dimethylbenzimidazole synthase [Sulfitobacter noctilucicola]